MQSFWRPGKLPIHGSLELPSEWPIPDTRTDGSYFHSVLGALEWHGMRKRLQLREQDLGIVPALKESPVKLSMPDIK